MPTDPPKKAAAVTTPHESQKVCEQDNNNPANSNINNKNSVKQRDTVEEEMRLNSLNHPPRGLLDRPRTDQSERYGHALPPRLDGVEPPHHHRHGLGVLPRVRQVRL